MLFCEAQPLWQISSTIYQSLNAMYGLPAMKLFNEKGAWLDFSSLVYWLLALCLFFTGCSQSSEEESSAPVEKVVAKDPLDIPLTPELSEGKTIWLSTCTNCHMHGIGGAPKIGDTEAWAPRIAQGEEVLFQHAINGHFGDSGSEMPAKGGNAALTDEEVKKAVLFMITASQ